MDELAQSIIDKLPQIQIELSDGDDTTQDKVISAELGERIVLPPQQLRIRDGDEVFELREALGNSIRLKVEGLIEARRAR